MIVDHSAADFIFSERLLDAGWKRNHGIQPRPCQVASGQRDERDGPPFFGDPTVAAVVGLDAISDVHMTDLRTLVRRAGKDLHEDLCTTGIECRIRSSGCISCKIRKPISPTE